MHTLSRIAAAASVATVGLAGFALTAASVSAAPSGTISPSTNVPDCNNDGPATPCTRSTVTATGLPANTRVALLECPTALVTDPSQCDNTTSDFGAGAGYSTDASGNFSTTRFPALKVPTLGDVALGNDPGFICDDTHSCVVLINTGTTFDFSLPKAFTNSFTFAGPGTNVPEVPWAAVLPIGALALCGGSYLVLRTRSRSSASAA